MWSGGGNALVTGRGKAKGGRWREMRLGVPTCRLFLAVSVSLERYPMWGVEEACGRVPGLEARESPSAVVIAVEPHVEESERNELYLLTMYC